MQAGANVNITAGGATPLHIAADHGSAEILKCLLKAGADPNVTDEVGKQMHSFTMLNFHYIYDHIHCHSVNLLLQALD